MSHSSSSKVSPNASAPFSVALMASAVAGGVEPFLTFPLEYVKTVQQLPRHSAKPSHPTASRPSAGAVESVAQSLLQSVRESELQPRSKFNSIAIVQDVFRRHSWQGLYRGVGILGAGGIAKSVVRMSVYDRTKSALQTPDRGLTGGRSLLAGLTAGVAETVLVVVPTETVKTRMIQAAALPESHPFHRASLRSASAVRALHSMGGLRALFAGTSATLVRQMAAAMTRFGSYQSLKNLVGNSMRPGQKLPSGITFALGAISGMATVAVTMPFDVVKTRMQSVGARQRYRNTWWCLVQTVQEEGVRALWRGSTMRLCRLTLSGAITFTVYEEITSLLGYG